MKHFLCCALAALMMVAAFAGCTNTTNSASTATTTTTANTAAADESLSKVTTKGEFVLGLDDSFPPMGYRDESNNIVGYDIDLATEVCSRLGVTLKLQPIDWDSKELELNNGNIDCIWNGMTTNAEREAAMNMSEPYMQNRQVVVVLADAGIKTLADLAGKNVVLQAGSTAVDALNDKADFKATLGEATEVDNNVTAMMELRQSTSQAVIMDEVVAKYYIANMANASEYKILDEVLAEEEYAIGFRKTDCALRDKVQTVLCEMKKDGKLAEITNKWFGEDISVVPDTFTATAAK